ncbi:hypothetical protein C2845_PM11G01050 [Panicum miliaceum]|uniref:Uncharacterized protein n=1 Tax=Panicum miliaceum TaxID=4540 RepID=A0A3L6RT29_PANMI|nr:hypothetical protein C2845_PM11G01050 [Panicum miliaceum]
MRTNGTENCHDANLVRDGHAAASPPLPSAGAARRGSLAGDGDRLPLPALHPALRPPATATTADGAAATAAATTNNTDAAAAATAGGHPSSSSATPLPSDLFPSVLPPAADLHALHARRSRPATAGASSDAIATATATNTASTSAADRHPSSSSAATPPLAFPSVVHWPPVPAAPPAAGLHA